MKKEIAEAWVKDLRSNPPQCKKFLYDGEGYCCLGRLALVVGAKFKLHDDKWVPHLNGNYNENFSSTLGKEILYVSGMKHCSGFIESTREELSFENDSGKTFAQIANLIEKHWEEL